MHNYQHEYDTTPDGTPTRYKGSRCITPGCTDTAHFPTIEAAFTKEGSR